MIKYLRDDSEDSWFLFLFIRRLIDRRLISRPIHVLIQEQNEIDRRVSIIKVRYI